MNKLIVHSIYIVLFLFFGNAYSQNRVNVLTKKIEYSFPYKLDDEIKISAIKADINLYGWDKNEVKITAHFISKNNDVEKAKEELKYIKYYI